MAVADIFLAYDIRGKVGEDLNSETVEKVGKAFADWLPKSGAVAIGYDMRPESQEFAEALMKGITEQGYDVWNIGQVATDMVYYAVGANKLAGGAMVTASHNPGEYNGIKLVREEAQGVGIESGLDLIRDAVVDEQFSPSERTGKIIEKNVMDGWVEHVLSFISVPNLNNYRIAIDAGNGMAGAVIPHIASRLPFQITAMYFDLDGTFPNHVANPLDPKNIVDLQKRVVDDQLDMGIAFDADGDRMLIVDEKGQPVSGSILTAMMAEYFLKEEPHQAIIHNAICGRIVPETITKFDGKPVKTRVGHSFIKQKMHENNALFGGEHSLHFFFRDNWYADSGLIGAIVALAAISESGKKLSDFVAEYDHYRQIPETNFEVDDKQAIIDKLAEAFSDGEQDTLDGLTVNYENSWFNVRPSNTEPLLRLNAEAETQEELDSLVSRVKKAAGFEPETEEE